MKASKQELQPLSELLVMARAKRGMTQAKVIKRLGCTPTTYRSWEKGQRPRAEWYVRLARHLDLSLEQVVSLVSASRV